MKRMMLALVALTASVSLGFSVADEKLTIKEVMKAWKENSADLIKGLKAKTPDFDKLKDKAVILARAGECLGMNEPPKGEKASWEKLTKAYATNTKAILTGIEKKDAKTAAAAAAKVGTSCGGCHKLHK